MGLVASSSTKKEGEPWPMNIVGMRLVVGLCSILTREERVETGVFLNYIRGSMIIYVKYYVNERSNESSAPH